MFTEAETLQELPKYNSTLACQRLFLHPVRKSHKGSGGSPQSQKYEGVDAFCQTHCALDETSLVLLDQTMNYLLHTRSKNFSIDFQITWDKRNRSVAGTI